MKTDTATFEQLIAGGILEIGDGYRAKNAELMGDGPLFLRSARVKNGTIFFDGDEFLSAAPDRLTSKMGREGDTVVTTKGNSTGVVAYVSAGAPAFVYSPHLSYWRSLDPANLDPGYLRYWARSSEFAGQLRGLAASTDMAPYLSLVDQKRLRITLPPPKVQAAIAEILGAFDDKIEANRAIGNIIGQMSRAMFRASFIDFIPGGERTPSGGTGGLPSGWATVPLDAAAKFLNGLAMQKFPPEDDQSLPVIKIKELRTGVTPASGRASRNLKPEYVVRDGDLLFSWSGSLEVVIWTGGEGALNQHLFKVTSDTYPQWFVYQWLLWHLDDFRATAHSKATTMGHIQRRHLTEATVAVPPDEHMPSLDAQFEPLHREAVGRQLECRILATTRDTLLRKLMSGELRVGDAEKIAEAAL